MVHQSIDRVRARHVKFRIDVVTRIRTQYKSENAMRQPHRQARNPRRLLRNPLVLAPTPIANPNAAARSASVERSERKSESYAVKPRRRSVPIRNVKSASELKMAASNKRATHTRSHVAEAEAEAAAPSPPPPLTAVHLPNAQALRQ
jgi:hypothetical protein